MALVVFARAVAIDGRVAVVVEDALTMDVSAYWVEVAAGCAEGMWVALMLFDCPACMPAASVSG